MKDRVETTVGRHIDCNFLRAESHFSSSCYCPPSFLSPQLPLALHLDLCPIKQKKKTAAAAIAYEVNFTSAFHNARRSLLMDFHLSPLPTHPALIIRGMRTPCARNARIRR